MDGKGRLPELYGARRDKGLFTGHEEIKKMTKYILYLEGHPELIEKIHDNSIRALQEYSLDSIARKLAKIIRSEFADQLP